MVCWNSFSDIFPERIASDHLIEHPIVSEIKIPVRINMEYLYKADCFKLEITRKFNN